MSGGADPWSVFFGPWNVFFDTTELVSGRSLHSAMAEAVERGQAHGFVSTLVIEEVIYRRLRELKSADDRAREALKTLRDYVDSSMGGRPSDEEWASAIRAKTRATLPGWVREVETTNIGLDEILKLSTRRKLPFRGDENPTGFHDAVILVSYVKYAVELDRCVFVSANTKDFTQQSVQALADEYGGGRWVIITGPELPGFLRDPELTQAVTDAFDREKPAIENYVRESVLPRMLAWAREVAGLASTSKIERLSITSVSATLDAAPQRSGQNTVRLHVNAQLVVQGVMEPVTLPGGITRETSGYFKYDFVLEGTGAVSLKGREIVGAPTITALDLVAITE
jgi:PIN domain